MTEECNWAGNVEYRGVVHRPATLDDAAALIRDATSVRALGSRHSFSDVADAACLVDVAAIERTPRFDADARTVTVSGAATYADIARALAPHGAALANMASLPHISVAGAISTGTHGSGASLGNLATAVSGLEFIAASGEIIEVDRRTPDFEGMVVNLGALGVITAVTLDVVFDFEISQHVYDDLTLDMVADQLIMIMQAAYSVSVFTTFSGDIDGQVGQVWIKRRVDGRDQSMAPGPTFLDAPAATMQHHPIPGHDGAACTRQLGEPGLWSDRLPHFRSGFTPSSGDEVQSEFFVGAIDATQALDALRRAASGFADRLMIAEIRAVAADELWMSPQFERSSVAFHFTWFAGDNDAAIRAVQEVLMPFGPRPHWGKAFHADLISVREAFPMLDDFVDLVGRYDPHGAFRNDWWHRVIGP